MTEAAPGPKVYEKARCCNAPHCALGLCTTCYQRYRKHLKDPRDAQAMAEILAIVSSHAGMKAAAKFARKDAQRVRRNERGRVSGYFRNSTLKRRYGITSEDFDRILAGQGGVCAICLEPPGDRTFYVDHCHTSGAVRGVLCPRCNTIAGVFDNARELFPAVERYLTSPP